MPEPGLKGSRYSAAIRRHAEKHRPSSELPKPIDVTTFKQEVGAQFSDELVVAEAFTNDKFISDLLVDANANGLTKKELANVISEIRRQLSVQANEEVRQEYMRKVSGADNILTAVVASFRKHVREAGAAFGVGMTTDVIERKKQLVGLAEDDRIEDDKERAAKVGQAQADLRALVGSVMQKEIERHRMRSFLEMGGKDFVNAVREYQSGRLSYSQLDDHAAFQAGLHNIVRKLEINTDEFVTGRPISVDDIGACSDHLRWKLQDDVVALAQLQHLDMISTDTYQAERVAEIKDSRERIITYGREVGKTAVFSGVTWGVTARVGTEAIVSKMLIGGFIAANCPAALGIAGGIATGAVAGMAAGIIRERYFNSKDRKKLQRMEAALGAVDDEVVVSAEVLHNSLVDRAKIVADLQAEIAAGANKQNELVQATQALYAVVAEVQVRMLRARAGNDVKRDYSEPEPAVADHATGHGHAKRIGHGVGFSRHHAAGHGAPAGHGVGRNTHSAGHGQAHGHEPVDHDWKVKATGERQDYISFGIANRTEAQLRLLQAFNSAQALVAAVRRADPARAAEWKAELDKLDRAAGQELDDAQMRLAERFAGQQRWAEVRGAVIGASGGAIAVLAMEAFGAVWEKGTQLVATLLADKTQATITDESTHLAATLLENGTVEINKAGIELAEVKLDLPSGVTTHDITLQFHDGDIEVYESATGKDLGLVSIEVSKVVDDEVLRPLIGETHLAVGRQAPFALGDTSYALSLNSHGEAAVFKLVDGSEPQAVGNGFSLVNDAVKAKLGDVPEALQFSVTPTADGAVIKSVFDEQPVVVLHVPNVPAGAAPVGPTVDMTPLTLERMFMPVGAEQAIADYGSTGGVSIDSAAAQAVGIKVGTVTEELLHAIPKSEVATGYRDQEGSTPDALLDTKIGYQEYDASSTTDYEDPTLPPISVTAAAVENKRLAATRVERSRAVVPTLEAKLTQFRERIKAAKNFAAVIENIKSSGRAEASDYNSIITLVTVAREVKQLLATKDGDLHYAAIDQTLHGNALHNFVAELEDTTARTELQAALVKGYGEQLDKFTAEVNFIQSRKDTERTPIQRLSDLKQKQADARLLGQAFVSVASALSFSEPALDVKARQVSEHITRAVAPLEIFMRVQLNPDLRKAFIEKLQEKGLLDKIDANLGEIAALTKLQQLAHDLASYPEGERALQELGLLHTKVPKFGKPQRDRITQIIDDLLAGDATYLSKGMVTITEPVPAAPKPPTVAPPAASPPESSPPAAAAVEDADDDEGVAVDEGFGL